MNLSWLVSICYTTGWFWCVLFGIHKHWILAILGGLFFLALELYCIKVKDTALYIQNLFLVFISLPLGFLLETFFTQTHLIHYANTSKNLPPVWIILLYPLFSLLLNHSLKLLKKNYLVAFFFGFLIAPLSYLGGMSLDAFTLSYPIMQTFFIIGICWGPFLCLLTKCANILEKAAKEALEERDAKGILKLLFDGDCPLCKREASILKKKDTRKKVQFIDISSKEFFSATENKIDYNTAMTQIHAIDGKGNLLAGIPVFAAVYARCGLMLTSTFLRIPLIAIALKPLYRLFAKNRLWITGRADTKHTQSSKGPMKQKKLWISFAFFIFLCFIVEIIGSFWTKASVSTWYPTLIKPSWTPPDWLFGPVWICLYVMIAISGWLIYKAKRSHNRSIALVFYGSQLALNFIWSFLFFSLKCPLLGLIDIILLSSCISLTIIKTWPVRRLASIILIPYFIWVLYAAALNAGIWLMNK